MTECSRRLILGPPGTGKTTRLIGVAQESFTGNEGDYALVSHTKVAARELSERCGMKKAHVGTLHAICFGLLGLTRQQVVDGPKLAAFGRSVGIDMDSARGYKSVGSEILALESVAACAGRALEEIYKSSIRPCSMSEFLYVSQSYRLWKQANGFLDFNDMLASVLTLRPKPQFTRLYVDEAQDLSPLQWAVISYLSGWASEVVVSGDDDQAIFIWGGADPEGLHRFSGHAGTLVETLVQSWRVPRAAYTLAAGVTARLRKRLLKPYKSAPRDGEFRRFGSIEALAQDDLLGAVVLYRDVAMRERLDAHITRLGLRCEALSGEPTLYNSRWARAVRTATTLLRGVPVSANDHKALLSVLFDDVRRIVMEHGVEPLRGRLLGSINAPPFMTEYLRSIDVTLPPQVRISTIHGFKGSEAERIVLLTGMSERVASQYGLNPDAEHRVFYVGLTRTKNSLAVVAGQNEYVV